MYEFMKRNTTILTTQYSANFYDKQQIFTQKYTLNLNVGRFLICVNSKYNSLSLKEGSTGVKLVASLIGLYEWLGIDIFIRKHGASTSYKIYHNPINTTPYTMIEALNKCITHYQICCKLE